MSAHRYWRCINVARAGGDVVPVSCGELQFRTSIGGPQAAVGGTAIGSSFWSLAPYDVSPLVPAKAFDGANSATSEIWHQSQSASSAYRFRDQWIGYDFGSPIEIVEVAVALRGDGHTPEQAWRSCSVEVSDDGTSWRLCCPANGFNATAGDFSLKPAQIAELSVFSAPLSATVSINNPLALNPGPPPNFSASLKYSWKNIYQGGAGTIQGTVTIENIPGARQVRLFDKRSGLVVAETWSSPTGHYEFNNVATDREYFVVAHDHLRVYNAVVQDMLTP